MRRTISETMIEKRCQPIEYEGRLVYGRWPMEVYEGQRLCLKLQFNRLHLRQAISLKITDGTIEVDGESGKYIVLWDSAPPQVEVICHPGKRRKRATLWIWNHWESEGGRMDAGLNNAGMVVEEDTPERTVLGCSPGRWASEPPDFKAVRVEILTQAPAR